MIELTHNKDGSSRGAATPQPEPRQHDSEGRMAEDQSIHSTRTNVSRSLDRWRGADVDPFGGVA